MRLFTNKKMMKKIAKEILPPFVHEALRKLIYKGRNIYNPTWHMVTGGNLKGREIFIDPKDGLWQKDMLEGGYDKFLFDYLKNLNMRGKIVFEIGAHIGFHAMNFALLVGDEGMVYAFEPNIFNHERMEINFARNPDLAKRAKTFNVAVSDNVGESEFYFSGGVDKGTSSGNFIADANTYYVKSKEFLELFKITKVRTISLDQVSSLTGADVVPNIIKIDVEGAESSVLKGAKDMLRRYKPLILMEVHSIFNMFKTCEILYPLEYNIALLKEETDGRCHIAAEP
jgi:FkbM family methyltransferase